METPLSAVDATSLFRNDFYFGKPRKKLKQLFFFATCSMPGRGKSGLGRKGKGREKREGEVGEGEVGEGEGAEVGQKSQWSLTDMRVC